MSLLYRILALISVCTVAITATGARLPGDVVPINYRIHFIPDMESATFTAYQAITVEVRKPTATILMHAVDLELQHVQIECRKRRRNAASTANATDETVTLTLADELERGPATIFIRYRGKLSSEPRALYISRSERRPYLVSHFEPTDARRAFPSFDEPALKATFDISVVVRSGDTAISNGRVIDDRPGPGEGQHTITFAKSPKMSTYLVALLVGDFECLKSSADGTPIRVCAVPEKKELGRYALGTIESTLRFYNRYFGLRYPFEKLDAVAVPQFAAAAMENTAAMIFREQSLLADERSPEHARRRIATAIAHEVAHMWLGNLVSIQWWDESWMKEGLATWIAPKAIAAATHSDILVEEAQATNSALALSSLEATRPIRTKAETPDEIKQTFDGVAYAKAAAVLRMLESMAGEERFCAGTRAYVRKYANRAASADHFQQIMAAATKKPLDRVMQSFVTQPGAPVVSATATCRGDATMLTLTQRRMFSDRQRYLAGSHEIWSIPITLRNLDQPGAAPRTVLLTSRSKTFVLNRCTPRLFINRDARGFYRTVHARQMLQDADLGTALNPAERVTLLNDQWALVRAGEQSVADHMAVIERLAGERNSVVVRVILGQINAVADVLIDDANRNRYRSWVSAYLRPLANELGWQPAADESDDRKRLRSDVLITLGYAGGDEETLRHARDLAGKTLDDPSLVDASLRDAVFQLASYEGDAPWYDTVKARLPQARDAHEHYRYLYSLAAFRDPVLIRRALDFALSSEMRSQDLAGFITTLMSAPSSRDIAWPFLKEHWFDLEKKMTEWGAAAIVEATGEFCGLRARDDVRRFFAEQPVPVAERVLKQSLERIESCAAYRDLQAPNVRRWLGR